MIDVTAAILIEAGAIFIARRQDDDLCGWEFPGGKIAPGETPETCLRRELQEEFAIDVTVGEFVGESVCCYGARTSRLLAYDCHHRVGIPECRVHTEYHWAPLSDLIGYDLLPADAPLGFEPVFLRGGAVAPAFRVRELEGAELDSRFFDPTLSQQRHATRVVPDTQRILEIVVRRRLSPQPSSADNR